MGNGMEMGTHFIFNGREVAEPVELVSEVLTALLEYV